jgi:hypothetical protein
MQLSAGYGPHPQEPTGERMVGRRTRGALTLPSSKRSIDSPMKARDHTSRVQQVRLAGGIFARRPGRLSWCELRDAQPAQPSRRTELQQARLPLVSLRRPLRRGDRGRAVARPYQKAAKVPVGMHARLDRVLRNANDLRYLFDRFFVIVDEIEHFPMERRKLRQALLNVSLAARRGLTAFLIWHG